ncbi:putative trehalose synthase [Pyronema domesticum]|nr:putative trehalose synthase [Pyronema domesticum]
MAPSIVEESYSFGSQPSIERRRSIIQQSPSDAWAGISLVDLFLGASAKKVDSGCVEIGLSIHDGTYSIDFLVQRVCPGPGEGESLGTAIKAAVKSSIVHFSEEHNGKFIGCGVTNSVLEICPDIASFLWRELDIIVMAFDVLQMMPVGNPSDEEEQADVFEFGVDEQADSAVRKAIMYFGPHNMPPPSIGFRNKVEVDTGGTIQLVQSLDEYKKTVSDETWRTVLHYAGALKKKKVKIAFFSATPQGGGVALMRHALIRYFKLLGIHASWYIPKPSPAVFRITKTNHNILQGVAAPDARFTQEKQDKYNEWITFNARRYWLSRGGPLAEGGADVVVIDDPQMPGLIPLIKECRPDVKIIYRSHIEIRSDLISQKGSPQEEVWQFLWDRIKDSDVFISHPVTGFVPVDVPSNMVALMPATTDWLDGLNKDMRDWDLRYYHHKLRIACHERGMTKLSYPARDYIAQIARFDPSKGIDTVLDSYLKLRMMYAETMPDAIPPQLLICGHGAIDDPDASIVYDKTIEHIDQEDFEDIREDIIVMRLGPSDQLLDALISTAKIVLQLSSREGFEVKVSEALHKGKPVIATRAGGIPLQVQHGKNGYLVKVGDSTACAERMFELMNNERKWREMSEYAKRSVSDEVGTVGNAVCWMYLAHKLANGEKVEGHEKWVADMAREEAGIPWCEKETRLPRQGLRVAVTE